MARACMEALDQAKYHAFAKLLMDGGPKNLGSIIKSTDVDIYRTKRSNSVVKLVNQPAHV
jgi:hypothetical protein